MPDRNCLTCRHTGKPVNISPCLECAFGGGEPFAEWEEEARQERIERRMKSQPMWDAAHRHRIKQEKKMAEPEGKSC